MQHGVAGQLVNHTRVLEQVARRPLRRAQQAQQPLMHLRALQQQRQITFAAQERLDPVHDPQGGLFSHAAFRQPLGGALHQLAKARARFVAQGQHLGVRAPLLQARAKLHRPLV